MPVCRITHDIRSFSVLTEGFVRDGPCCMGCYLTLATGEADSGRDLLPYMRATDPKILPTFATVECLG